MGIFGAQQHRHGDDQGLLGAMTREQQQPYDGGGHLDQVLAGAPGQQTLPQPWNKVSVDALAPLPALHRRPPGLETGDGTGMWKLPLAMMQRMEEAMRHVRRRGNHDD
jgi:hypothetical protein